MFHIHVHIEVVPLVINESKQRTYKSRFITDETRRVLKSKPTLKRWSNRSPTVEPRWVRPTTDHQASANLTESRHKAEPIIKSEARPTGVQLKRSAKLLTVIGITAKHAVCRITFMLYPILFFFFFFFLSYFTFEKFILYMDSSVNLLLLHVIFCGISIITVTFKHLSIFLTKDIISHR